MSDNAGHRPGEPDDVDKEFERIVAGIELEAPDVVEERERRDTTSTEDDLPPVSGPVFEPRFSDRMSRDDYEEFGEQDDDPDDHFVPPEPTRQRVGPLTWLGWLGAVGAPSFMVLVAIFGWYIPGEFAALLVGCFVAGVVYLIMTMSRDTDDGDDGAVI